MWGMGLFGIGCRLASSFTISSMRWLMPMNRDQHRIRNGSGGGTKETVIGRDRLSKGCIDNGVQNCLCWSVHLHLVHYATSGRSAFNESVSHILAYLVG